MFGRFKCAGGEDEHWPNGEVSDHGVRGSVWRCVEWLWPWGDYGEIVKGSLVFSLLLLLST